MMLLLLGCPVPLEWASVDPPRAGGVEALAVEDFERDLWLLAQPDPGPALEQRWRDMGLRVEGPCGVREGGPGLVLVQAHDLATTAMAISLAKTFDGTEPPSDIWFCSAPTELPETPSTTLLLVAPSEAASELLEATRQAHAELDASL